MIRPAGFDDRFNIAALMIQVWLHTYARNGLRDTISRYVLTEYTPEKIAAEIGVPGKRWLVAERDQHIVALAVLELAADCPVTQRSLPCLHKLYVQEHFTGKGIGRNLLDEVMALSATTGADTMWLTVSPRNPRAVAFYQRHGFVHVGSTDFVLEHERHENHILHKPI